MNPNADYNCLKTFGSCFSEDIRIPAVSFYAISGLRNLVHLVWEAKSQCNCRVQRLTSGRHLMAS